VKRAVICSPKGGAGKTFLTRCLAVAAARERLSVATADLDPQETLTKWVRRRPAGITPLCHYSVTWENVDSLVEEGGIESCDVLFIDTPPSIEMYPAKLKRLVTGSDLALVPCRPSYDDVESAVPFLRALREHGCPVFAVVNATAPRINVNFEKGLLAEIADVCPIELRQRIDHTRASVRGLSVADFPSHEGAKEIDALWKFVRRHLMGTKEGSRVAA
jgi:chromosome partitioning protein